MPRVSKSNKGRPHVLSAEIYSYIAGNTSLTKPQVKECFEAYAKMLYELATSEFVDRGLRIPLPNIGTFQFFKRKGFKKGSTYTNVNYFIDANDNNKFTVREKDTEAYYNLRLKIFPMFAQEVKERTKFFET